MIINSRLEQIRTKVIDRSLLLISVFSLIALVPSLIRTYEIGYQNIMSVQILAVLIIISLFYFRNQLTLNFKLHTLLIIFTVIPLLGIWYFRMLGGSFLFVVAIMLSCLTYGFRMALYYSIIFVVIFACIGYIHRLGGTSPLLDFGEYSNNQTTWLTAITGYTFTLIVLLDTASHFYKLFVEKLKESVKLNFQLINKNAKLEITERRYRSLFTGSSDGIVLVDQDLRIVDCNPSYLKLVGYRLEELKGRKYSYGIPKKSIDHNLDDLFIEQADSQDNKQPIFLETKHKNGELIPIEVIAYRFHEDNEVYLWGVIKDLRKIKKLESQVYSRMIEAEENERERYAKEIHDGLGPLL